MKGMHIRGTKFGELVDGFKLLLCVLLVVPIRLWIDQKDQPEAPIVHSNPVRSPTDCKVTTTVPTQSPNSLRRLSCQWLNLVQAPVTKYWMSQLCYVVCLMWFTAAVVESTCGSTVLDSGVCIWLLCLQLEGLRCRWLLRSSLQRSTASQWLQEGLMIIFVLVFYLSRLSPLTAALRPYAYHIRMTSACVLVFHYMKYMETFMPMYSTLGPLFYHIRLLSLNDVLSFALLCWPFLVGFGVITEVALYPDRHPFEYHNMQAMFHRTLSTLFKTPNSELIYPNDDCEAHYSTPYENSTFCRSASFDDVNCNHRGLFPVLFFTSYVLLLKIVLLTLLFALFNTSMITLDMLTIWRYQKLHLITAFELANPFPPPFSPIMYLFWVGRAVFRFVTASPNKQSESTEKTCDQCSNEAMLYFWQCVGKSTLEKTEANRAN
jgi:hypothetical protein